MGVVCCLVLTEGGGEGGDEDGEDEGVAMPDSVQLALLHKVDQGTGHKDRAHTHTRAHTYTHVF